MILFLLITRLFIQNTTDCLCNRDEKIVFSFQTKNQKVVSICNGAKDSYLVYRFGTKAKIEMQYPHILDKNSWQKFGYYSYFRGGGSTNAGVDENRLSFINNEVRYSINQEYSALDDQIKISISIELPSKTTEIKGIIKTKKGDLSILQDRVPKAEF